MTSSRIPTPQQTRMISPPPESLGFCWDKIKGKNCKFLNVFTDNSGRQRAICFNQPPVAGYQNAVVTPHDGKSLLAHWCGNYVEDTDTQSPVQIIPDSTSTS